MTCPFHTLNREKLTYVCDAAVIVSQINQRALLHILTASHWQYVIDLKHHINDPMCLKVLLLDGRETYLRPGCHCGGIPSDSHIANAGKSPMSRMPLWSYPKRINTIMYFNFPTSAACDSLGLGYCHNCIPGVEVLITNQM